MLKNYNVKLLFLSFIPFIVWLIPLFSGNVLITSHTFIFGILFLHLCLSTSHRNKYARYIALIALTILVLTLYQEGLSNDMFGSLYPIFLSLFSIYYLFLNFFLSKK